MMFGHLLRAEWTKLVSIRRWVLALLGTIGLTVLMGLVAGNGGTIDINENPNFVVGPGNTPVTDEFEFFHQPLTGDGSITTQVLNQAASHERAGAGLMVKQNLASGSQYAAVMVTPKAGVRFSTNYTTDIEGSGGNAPRWLRITRAGNTVTGYESADGNAWREVGKTSLKNLPSTVEIGLFVSSPPKLTVERSAGATSVGGKQTAGEASFGSVHVDGAQQAWESTRIGRAIPSGEEEGPGKPDKPSRPDEPRGTTEANGVYTIKGSGKIGPEEPDDDMVQISLFGVLIGLISVVVVAVLFVTSEYKRGMIRTTFSATPRRGLVLMAKAVVLGLASFAIALAACVTTFLVTIPILRDHGFAPPAFPTPSLTDPGVLRAILATSTFVAAIAVLSLAAGTIMRNSAAAITTVISLTILPAIVSTMLPAVAGKTLMLVTPAGGFATQRVKPPTETLVEPWSMLSPWTGLGIALGYAAVAFVMALLLVRRRDA